MKNKYDIRGNDTAIFLNSKKYGPMEALISTIKFERVNEFVNSWYPWWSDKSQSFYVLGNKPKSKGTRGIEYLHRWITECPVGLEVDHFNNNGLINTDGNLRIANKSENMQNRRGAAKHNKSTGIRNVTYSKAFGKWKAYVIVNRKMIHLGYFTDIDEAEKAAKEGRKKHMPFSNEAS